MAGMTQKNLCSFISIVVSCCTLDNCTRYFCQWSLVTGPMKTPDDKEGFFSRSGYSLQFCWSDLVITEIFSNSAASFLLVGACRCACSVPCFQDDLSVLEVFRLKVLKFANKVSNFFVCQVCLLNSYVLFQKQIKSPCHIELHLCCDRVPRFFSVFFFFYRSRHYWIVDKMPPWAIVTQNNKLLNSTSFRIARALVGRLPRLSCITHMDIIL